MLLPPRQPLADRVRRLGALPCGQQLGALLAEARRPLHVGAGEAGVAQVGVRGLAERVRRQHLGVAQRLEEGRAGDRGAPVLANAALPLILREQHLHQEPQLLPQQPPARVAVVDVHRLLLRRAAGHGRPPVGPPSAALRMRARQAALEWRWMLSVDVEKSSHPSPGAPARPSSHRWPSTHMHGTVLAGPGHLLRNGAGLPKLVPGATVSRPTTTNHGHV
eukprot:COSAG04_NODE_837_length_9971_cov_6.099271_11_plen_220_part_00